MPMTSQQVQSTTHKNDSLVPVEPNVKSAKTRKLSLHGMSAKAKTAKSADPSCYNPPVSQKTDPAVDAAGLFENRIGECDMAIYAWPGLAVNITEARIAPVWIEHRYTEDDGGSIHRHFTAPKKRKGTTEINATVTWLVKAEDTKDGRPLCQGRWLEFHTMRADDGIKELNARFFELIGQEEMAKFEKWNKNGAEATELWPLINEKDVH